MSIRILLVDDHDLMRDGLRSILGKESDAEVVGEAANGRDAVRLAADLQPDVVLMDVAMKDMNGIEATRQIKAERNATRIVALSSHPDRRYVTAMLRAGACGYVLKAKAYSELRRAVRAAVAGRSFLSEEVARSVIDEVRAPALEEQPAAKVLGPREREVLQLLAEGFSSGEIAERLHVATSTVDTHRRNLMRKLDLHTVAELTKYAIREGLTSVEA